jgi:hypothetical protein
MDNVHISTHFPAHHNLIAGCLGYDVLESEAEKDHD